MLPSNVTATRIHEAKRLKEEGNNLFREGSFRKARILYSKVFAYINGLVPDGGLMQYSSALGKIPPTEQETHQIQDLRVSCYSNIAMCYLKLEDYEHVEEYCNKTLEIDENHVKSHYRKGVAFACRNRLDAARKSLEMAMQLDPQNSAAKKELVNVKHRIRLSDERSNKKLAQALSGAI